MLDSISQRRWLATVIVLTVALVEIPYLIAFAQNGNGWVFAGMIWSPHDYAQYASAMRQGAATQGWLIHDLLSHEPHNPAFIYALYVLLGKFAALTGLETHIVFHAAEILARVALLLALWQGTSLLFQETRRRRLALLITVFTGGLGAWMLGMAIIFRLPLQWSIFTAADLSVPELNTFLVMFTAPHLMLGLGAIMVWATSFCGLLERPSVAVVSRIILSTLVVGVTNPFSLVTLGLIAGAHLSIRWLRLRRVDRASLLVILAMAISAGPMLAYNVFVFGRDPFWGATYGAQNSLPSAPPAALALSYGALLVFALIGARRLLQNDSEGARLVVVWIVLITLLMYAPVTFQRRFGFGLHPVLALAATLGVERTLARMRAASQGGLPWRWRVIRSVSGLALAGTPIVFYLLMLRAAALPTDEILRSGVFHRAQVQTAATWLADHVGPDDLVLAEAHTSNYIGGWLLGRVYAAHWVATADFPEKLRLTNWFYSTDDAAAREELLDELGVRYVVYGPRERAMGGPPPDLDDLRPVFSAPDLTIYEIQGVLSASTASVGGR